MKNIYLLIFLLLLYSCGTTSSNDVKTSDSQKITAIEYGTIKTSLPVKIKGESNWIGTTAGAMIGGLLGTQVCGEEEIVGTKCQDIAVVFGTIGGAAAGTVIQATLGNHDGYQYVIDVDDSSDDIAIVQGSETKLNDGERVVIIFGKTIRVLPYSG